MHFGSLAGPETIFGAATAVAHRLSNAALTRQPRQPTLDNLGFSMNFLLQRLTITLTIFVLMGVPGPRQRLYPVNYLVAATDSAVKKV
jgi:hypothetical protein